MSLLFICLYVVYLMTCQYLRLYSVEWLENNELGKLWKEVVGE